MTIGLALIAAATVAGGFADLDVIDRQVAAFTGAPVGAVGGAITPVDRRLRLQRCRNGLALSWRTTMHDSVVVQCGDANGWRIFVPVKQAPQVAAAQQPDAINRGDAVGHLPVRVEGRGVSVRFGGVKHTDAWSLPANERVSLRILPD